MTTGRTWIQSIASVLAFSLVMLSQASALGTKDVEPTKSLDTPQIKAELQKAIDIAGNDESLIVTQRQQCKALPDLPVVHLEPGSEKKAEPTKLFDNLYYVGGTEVGCFIFTTDEGYIMIDSGYSYMPESYIIPDMKKLGLDPAQVKYILITHAGPDHIGGASYFQKNFGTHIVMSKEEWAGMPRDGSTHFGATPPEMDMIGADGQKLTLGSTTVTIVETPRRLNGGGLSYIVPVFDDGNPHRLATYGNTNVVGTLADKKLYRESLEKFLSYVDKEEVDVVISNHPFVDGSLAMMKQLRDRKAGEPNPFVFGQERARKFFELLDQCAIVVTLRQEAGLDDTGTKLAPPAASAATASLDTPQIKAELQKAIDLAGDDEALIVAQRQQTKTADFSDIDPVILEPTKLFDNLYFLGSHKVGSFLFTTSDGYIMIDAGYEDYPEKVIIPGMKKLGLDPAKIKYILITHAGPDHIGGASYFQKNYGTHIVMSREEWEDAAKQSTAVTWPLPSRDMVGADGQELTLGDTTITIVETPRRVNGGGLSYIAPVFDEGEPHTFATYGNTNVVGTLEDKKLYRDAVARFISYAEKAKVDVVISNHPFVDGSIRTMETLKNLQSGEPNPFVWGQEKARRFFDILDQSAVIMILRQEAGLDETGTKRADQNNDSSARPAARRP